MSVHCGYEKKKGEQKVRAASLMEGPKLSWTYWINAVNQPLEVRKSYILVVKCVKREISL